MVEVECTWLAREECLVVTCKRYFYVVCGVPPPPPPLFTFMLKTSLCIISWPPWLDIRDWSHCILPMGQAGMFFFVCVFRWKDAGRTQKQLLGQQLVSPDGVRASRTKYSPKVSICFSHCRFPALSRTQRCAKSQSSTMPLLQCPRGSVTGWSSSSVQFSSANIRKKPLVLVTQSLPLAFSTQSTPRLPKLFIERTVALHSVGRFEFFGRFVSSSWLDLKHFV